MTPQDPGVYISPAQTYAEVQNLTKAVARIESKVDRFIDEAKDIRADVQDHELRLRTLERARWPLPTIGVISGVGGAVAAAVALLQH